MVLELNLSIYKGIQGFLFMKIGIFLFDNKVIINNLWFYLGL